MHFPVGASLLAKLLGAEGVFQEARGDVALIMRFRQQEEFPINGVTQFRQIPLAKLRQQHHAVRFEINDHPRPPRNQLIRLAIFRLMRHEADLALFELLAQARRIENLDLARHHL